MNTGQVKQIVKLWIDQQLAHYPGLIAAHLVGGITTMPTYAPFPAYKDVDFHLIFAEGSPALKRHGPFSNNVETLYQGLMLEGGLKSICEYHSAETVLANPEIAHHLMVEGSILYDPSDLLARLHIQVARDFACRRWVRARIEHERKGLQGALNLLPLARRTQGSLGGAEVSILGYTMTFLAATLCVATLRSPSTGSRSLLKLREVLSAYQRLDLYEDLLGIMGVATSNPAQVTQLLAEGVALFDRAVAVKRSPHPFGHKMHAHLRPYLQAACASLIEQGDHREALFWLTPFYLAACAILQADGDPGEKVQSAKRSTVFLMELGLECAETRAARWESANQLYARFFDLAEELVDQQPSIVG